MDSQDAPRTPTAQGSLFFSSFHLDLRGGRLLCGEEPVPLRPKTWAVLLYLAERPGVLVSKDDLLEAVWPDVAVTPDTLTKSIGEIRSALGDDSRTPRCIETVHRRGFRFIAPTSAAPAVEHPGPRWRGTSARLLVGREAELERLQKLFERACGGERQIAFVTGLAGVGKTEVVKAFLDKVRLSSPRAWIGGGACIEQHGPREAYMPVLDALERLAREPKSERLRRLLQRMAPTWLAQMPWLLENEAEGLRRSLRAVRAERMLREFAALTEELTAEAPLVLVLEDLHWSDPSTVDLLSVLAARREAARLLVIATYRPAEVAVHGHVLGQAVRTLQMHHRCAQIPLHELTCDDVQRYLDLRFPGADFGAELAPVVHASTDGNALFMIAVVDHMVTRGWILETEPGWALAVDPRYNELGLPDDARHMIQMQFGNLSPSDRTLLEAASAAGNEFAVRTVAAALGRDAEEVEMQCEALALAHRFLRLVGTGEWPDGSPARIYSFTHELYRQAAYAEIPAGQRQRLHQRLGEALETAYAARVDEIAPELAGHFEGARDHTRALRYLDAAAARALQRFAAREAIGYLQSAIALTARIADDDERARRELELRLAMASPLNDVEGFSAEAVRVNARRAYDLSARAGNLERVFQVVYTLGHYYIVRCDLDLAPQLELEAEQLAERLGTAAYRLLADSLVTRMEVSSGCFDAACRLAELRLLAPGAEAVAMPFSYGADPVLSARCMYAQALWFTGREDRAVSTMRACVEASKEHGVSFTQVAVLGQSCILGVFRRQVDEVAQAAERLVALSEEQGLAFWHAMALALRGWAWVQSGRVAEGIEELERGLGALLAGGACLFSTHVRAFLAEAHLRSGAPGVGLGLVVEALEVAETTIDRSYRPELWRLKGEMLLAAAPSARRGRKTTTAPGAGEPTWDEAESCFLQALETARTSHAKALELRAATSLARAWKARQRGGEATALLAEVCSWFGAADSPDLAEARALMMGPS